jgi:hypothetical protein
MSLPAAAAKLTFLVARRRAMASGSLPAIYKMLSIIEFEAAMGLHDIINTRSLRQLEKDYNIKITEEARRVAGAFEPSTAQELKEEEQFLRQRWASVANHPQRQFVTCEPISNI